MTDGRFEETRTALLAAALGRNLAPGPVGKTMVLRTIRQLLVLVSFQELCQQIQLSITGLGSSYFIGNQILVEKLPC